MRKVIYVIISAGILTALIWLFSERVVSVNNSAGKADLSFIKPPASGPDLQRWFFEKWHYPYGAVLDRDFLERTWVDIRALPSEDQFANPPTTHWYLIGPRGMRRSSDVTYSGRILDIAPPQYGAKLRAAAASGGLWQYKPIPVFLKPIPMTNNLITQVVSTFATKPNDKHHILIGTGEAWIRGGNGMFIKRDSLSTWETIPLTPEPTAIYRIRYTPNNPNIVHAVTNTGYYRSTDGGENWTRSFTGDITDIAIDPLATHLIYITRWGAGGGVYKSTDGGTTWFQLTNGLPTTNVGRSAISLCKINAKVLYASLGRNDDHTLMGTFKTTDNGQNWIDVSPPDLSVIGGNAWYNNVISVCPTNQNIVLVGMTQLLRTTNGGSSWSLINTPAVHVDHHAITWADDGVTVWNGNDGGITKSTDQGATWFTEGNSFPITQFYNIGVSRTDPHITFGGAQDNGLIGITQSGGDWWQRKSGDGAGIAIDPEDATRIYAVDGAFGGGVLFRRFRSTNTGLQWITFTVGITGDMNWAPKIRTNNRDADILYTNANEYVYISQTPHDIWQKLNTTPFPATVSEVAVSLDDVVYACLNSGVDGQRLRVYVNGNWYERTNGLPSGARVRKVVPHPVWPNKAYALMDGLNTPGEKIFRTDNYGTSWINVTGNLPNVPVADVVILPSLFNDNNLYLGTEFGCYRTADGGFSWHRWNYGMPEANIITEMDYIDSLLVNGKFYVVAGTYGRSIWMREVHSEDPVGITPSESQKPETIVLHQNYPNPFNPTTTITFNLPHALRIKLHVYDITGRKVKTLVSGQMSAGRHAVIWNGTNDAGESVASGVYLYRLRVGDRMVQTRKMVLLR